MEHQSENKVCQNCKNDFTIEPDDFSFYEKIKVPAPTFCPECRFKQRYAFRNNIILHKDVCDLCSKNIISMYSSNNTFPVYCRECFYGDQWDQNLSGMNLDFSKSFFAQVDELFKKAPRMNLVGVGKVNSDYSNHATDVKNVYLSFSVGVSEDCYFMGPQCVGDKNCSSCSMTRNSEWSYDLIDCEHCYKTAFSQNCGNCIESLFLFDCRNCSNCIGSVNLRNKNYCIFNEQYSKEDYFKIKESLKLETYEGLNKFKEAFQEFKNKFPKKYAVLENTQNSTGNYILNSRNVKNSFVVFDSENIKYGFVSNGAKNCMDVSHTYPSSENSYFAQAPIESNNIYFSSFIYSNCYEVYYSDNCYSSSYLFGCIGLRNKQYCILNKQYTKEEYFELIEKIKLHMKEMPYIDNKGRVYKYGDFFPFEMSPFGYNETPLQEYFPLSKEEAVEQGFNWFNKENNDYILNILNENFHKIINYDFSINSVIECKNKGSVLNNCIGSFRVHPDELNIFKSLNIFIPDICHNCRNANRIKARNPLKLWHRKCMKEGCDNEFETSYDPNRSEIVYCEKCYQAEVY
jgi:hypothetical protein